MQTNKVSKPLQAGTYYWLKDQDGLWVIGLCWDDNNSMAVCGSDIISPLSDYKQVIRLGILPHFLEGSK